MYSIAKLLSDEPKKLETFILTLLKVFCTVWIAQCLFGFNPDWSNFTLESFFKNFRVDESLYFVLTAFGVWYLLWELIIELLVEVFIQWLSKSGNPENTLKWYLRLTNSVKMKDERILDIKPNILHFTESIKDGSEDYPFMIQTRAKQIFSVGLVSFVLLITSEISLGGWQVFLAVFILFNFLVISAAQRKLHDYYLEHQDKIRSFYYPMGQVQKIKNVLQQVEFLNSKYELKSHRKRLILKQTKPIDFLPEEITVFPMFLNNVELGDRILDEAGDVIQKRLEKNKLSIICSNFYCPEKQLTKLNEKTYCIHGEGQNAIYKGFEELIHLLKMSHYSNRTSHESDEATELLEE